MGIEQFFSSIEENNITNLETSFTKILAKQIKTHYLYIDFNSIVYITSASVKSDLNYILYKFLTKEYESKTFKKLIAEYKITDNYFNDTVKFSRIYHNKLTEIILKKIEEYIINIVTNYIFPKTLKLLYIAVDGVPSRSKIEEQKKRRYLGYTISVIKKKIFEKYSKELENTNIHRYKYEKLKFEWGHNNITPGTPFMTTLDNLLKSDKFSRKLKHICTNLKSYIVSGFNEYGEGEKKIVDHLRLSEQKPGDYTIYSPDSDMTLLGLLLNTSMSLTDPRRITKLKILRHNQQQKNYDIINIDNLSNNIYRYIINNFTSLDNPRKDSIINDIVLILTIFGNDFLPKIESFIVRQDFNRIIDKYIVVLLLQKHKARFNYLIEYNKTNDQDKKINQKFLFELIKELQKDEGGNLQKKYMATHYRNYNKLKSIMGADQENFTKVFNTFLDDLYKFNNDVKKFNNNDEGNINYIISKWSKKNTFMDKIKRLTILGLSKNTEDDEFIRSYIDYYIHHKTLPDISVLFKTYSKSLKSKHHQDRLRKSLSYIDKNLKVTAYDREKYKFENMLDEYQDKLNAYSLDLGYINIDPKNYIWKTEKIEDNVKKYYSDFFEIKDISIDNPKMQNLVQHYIDGLVWVFDYYYNSLNNDNTMETWHYPFSHAPLVTQIYYLLRKKNKYNNYIEKVRQKIKKYVVTKVDYFNSLEHLMYVTPLPILLIIMPKKYHKFIEESKYYSDINNIIHRIWNKKTNDEIDCRGALFLTKCNITILEDYYKFDQIKKYFIKPLRNIEKNIEKNIDIDHIKPSLSESNYKIYKYFKKRYLLNGGYQNKRMYKWFKSINN